MPKEKTKKIGRPSNYSKQLALKICERIASGESLVRICRDEEMPGYQTILDWLGRDDEPYSGFSGMYARAKEHQADYLAEEILEISDDGRNDKFVDDEGQLKIDYDHIQRSRLRVDTRKWIASKLKPRKYGEKLQHETGEGGFKVILEDYRAGDQNPPTTQTK